MICSILFFVQLKNVKQVKKVAEKTNAEKLRKYCEKYSIENAEAVLLTSIENEWI